MKKEGNAVITCAASRYFITDYQGNNRMVSNKDGKTQNVPIKIRKQFERERFVADVRGFFVNVKGCEL